MNLFLDTETTGLPGKYMDWEKDYQRFPHIVEIAWRIGSKQKRFLIHQEGRVIPKEATAVHGITSKMGNDKKTTQPASFVYRELLIDAVPATSIINHNVHFDVRIIKANMIRVFGLDSEECKNMVDIFHKDKRIDTMTNSAVVKLLKKWPKLSELYHYLFPGETFDKHTAMGDVLACERCYYELRKRKIL